jgi:3',5'-cyclic AMP phosphodiesterase CpdA
MRIALLTDSHLAVPTGVVLENCFRVRDWVAETRPDATLHLGDVTADGAKHPAHFAVAAEIFGGWPTPIQILSGNHDVGDNDDIARSAKEKIVDQALIDRHRSALGADHWRLQAEGWTLIGLNAQLMGSGGGEAAQLAWLDTVLAEAEGPVGLLLHKPLFRNAPDDTERHLRYVPPEPRRRLMEKLSGVDLRFVASGHTHQYRRLDFRGVEHVWVPSCAFFVPDRMQETIGEKLVGAMVLTLTPERHAFDLVIPRGLRRNDLLDQVDIYPQLADPGPAH